MVRSVVVLLCYLSGLWIGGNAWISTTFTHHPSSTITTTRRMLEEPHHQEDAAKNITDLAEKKVRLLKVQAEIDRILNSPVDAPFDAESEFQKVVSISPPLVPEGSSEYAYEEQVSQMEAALYSAVKQQDYTLASQRKEQISQLHVDDCGLVLQANSRFYKAFSKKDMDEMERVWLQDRSCVCIHPSHKPLVGARDIMKSWTKMFQSSNGSFQRNWMEPQQIRLTVQATTAIVTCEEHVYTRRFVRGQTRQTELVNQLQATNLFRKIGGKWFLTHHHSSWHADSSAAKLALQGGDSKTTKQDESSSNSEMEHILGANNVGPILGADDKENPKDSNPKRVIMGSLSDLLSGNLGDVLDGGSTNNKNGDIGDLFSNNNGENSAIIQFHKIDDDDHEDDDDEDEEDSVGMLQQWANNKKQAKSKDSLRQNCIASLRKLAFNGRISQKQKRMLLTDIISCSAKGEYSMVEVAYELLLAEQEQRQGSDDEEDDAEEEFADQCRVFADQQAMGGDGGI